MAYIQGNIRIPNLPMGKVVNEQGFASDDEQTFRQTLITSLQANFGNEGCVIPSLSASDITTIQNNSYVDPANGNTVYTCAYGTLVYNTTANSIMATIDDGTGKPIFKTVTLT
jgi:hypothetical protein